MRRDWVKRNWPVLGPLPAVAVTSLVIWLATTHAQKSQNDSCAIQVFVRAHKDVDVTVPCMAREDMISIVSTFFARGDEQSEKKFRKLLTDGGDVTLQITSKKL
jgi:hypothetical protein